MLWARFWPWTYGRRVFCDGKFCWKIMRVLSHEWNQQNNKDLRTCFFSQSRRNITGALLWRFRSNRGDYTSAGVGSKRS
ncbi:hypothetical protein BU23DRAFT_117545 [Bimuria novae-zelandiae CBS 107.79]|uniref:Uncharacterized protein n=1 Tax=Bimuria novae-zelandiae CBS 107.79 TaxID=1447943 RepID=A0A6A5VL22_9PLEO|nr:hypothetical protein BU23DRAFT_117545 [Bimuria novae-zelandiae CBS 107.79]